jgi:hypothetical protein
MGRKNTKDKKFLQSYNMECKKREMKEEMKEKT